MYDIPVASKGRRKSSHVITKYVPSGVNSTFAMQAYGSMTRNVIQSMVTLLYLTNNITKVITKCILPMNSNRLDLAEHKLKFHATNPLAVLESSCLSNRFGHDHIHCFG